MKKTAKRKTRKATAKKTPEKKTRKTTKEIVVRDEKQTAIQMTETGQLLKMAVDKNLDVEKLEKLIELKHREEERAAKIDFDHHFAEMQKQFPIVYKKKSVKNDKGKILYKYCPLHVLERAFRKIILDNGFSYRFGSHTGKEGTTQPYCIVSGWGHEVETPLDIPITKLTSATNRIQEYGAALSYGYRYAFCAAFGIVIAGEDNDSQTPKDPIDDPEEKPTDFNAAGAVDAEIVSEAQDIEKVRAECSALRRDMAHSKLFTTAELKECTDQFSRHGDDIAKLRADYTAWFDVLEMKRKEKKHA
jgi:hypothetical protein